MSNAHYFLYYTKANGEASLGSLSFYGYKAKVINSAFFAPNKDVFYYSYYSKVSRLRLNHPFHKSFLSYSYSFYYHYHPSRTSLIFLSYAYFGVFFSQPLFIFLGIVAFFVQSSFYRHINSLAYKGIYLS